MASRCTACGCLNTLHDDAGVCNGRCAWRSMNPRPPCILDAEIVEVQQEDSAAAPPAPEVIDGQVIDVIDDPAPTLTVRRTPTGRECWVRLFSRSPFFTSGDQDHGVKAAYAREDNPHALTLDLAGHGLYEISVLAWRVNMRDTRRTKNGLAHRSTGQALRVLGPDSLDLLVEFPPALPGRRRRWAQMTNPGQLEHPGDDPKHWRFDVPYSDVNAHLPQRGPGSAPTWGGDDGFKPLGLLKELE